MKGLLDNMFDFDHDGEAWIFSKEQQRDSLLIT